MNEPLIRVVKKAELGSRETFILRLEAILLALVAGGLFILIIGQNPFVIYKTIITGALRSGMAIQATVKIAIPLLIASRGVTLAFKMKFWNIGAEGQIIAGGICASYFALFHSGWNHWVLVIVMFIAGAVGGGLWGLIPAWFKTKYDTNETLFTLMLNYIALNIIVFLREGPWRDPGSQGYAKIARFDKNAALDKVFGIQFGWIIALVLLVLVFVYMKYSKQGYEIGVVGESQETARYAGMNVRKVILRTMFLSGAVCGIGGMVQATGSDVGRGRRCWLYRNYCGMAGTAQPAGNSDCHGSVQHSGKGQQRCAVFLRSVLRQCGRASGNYPVLHSGMRAVHTV